MFEINKKKAVIDLLTHIKDGLYDSLENLEPFRKEKMFLVSTMSFSLKKIHFWCFFTHKLASKCVLLNFYLLYKSMIWQIVKNHMILSWQEVFQPIFWLWMHVSKCWSVLKVLGDVIKVCQNKSDYKEKRRVCNAIFFRLQSIRCYYIFLEFRLQQILSIMLLILCIIWAAILI